MDEEIFSSQLERQIVPMSQQLVDSILMEDDADHLLAHRDSFTGDVGDNSQNNNNDAEEDDAGKKFCLAAKKGIVELVKERKETLKPRSEILFEMQKDFRSFLAKAKAAKTLTDRNCRDLSKLCGRGFVLTPDIKLAAELRKQLIEIDVLKVENS